MHPIAELDSRPTRCPTASSVRAAALVFAVVVAFSVRPSAARADVCKPGETLACWCPPGRAGVSVCNASGMPGDCSCTTGGPEVLGADRCAGGKTLPCWCDSGVAGVALCDGAGTVRDCSCPEAATPAAGCEPGETLACWCASGEAGVALCDATGALDHCTCGTTQAAGTGSGGQNPPPATGTNSGAAVSVLPRALVATGIAPGEIDLCWGSAGGGGSYTVHRDGALVATTSETCATDKGLTAGATHVYEVKAGGAAVGAPLAAVAPHADADGDVVAGELRSYTTIRSIGFEWDVSGDADNDAAATVRFRAAGTRAWRETLPLMRVRHADHDMLAGSLLFLEPGTEYEVVLHLSDPDGGARTLRTRATTRPVPVLPTGGRTFHVKPGAGGGDGSEGNPFLGVAAAAAAAQPGDVMLLHAGHYGGRVAFAVAGEPGRPVAWKAAGDGDAVFAGIDVHASHVRLEGLKVEAGGGYDFPVGIQTKGAPAAPNDVAVVRCNITGNHYALWLNGGGSDWYIADNVIVGDTDPAGGSFSGEGVELQRTGGHVVEHNRISRVADGVSYCSVNCDIVGNDIFDTSDDGIEPDGGFANIRMWGNRLHNTGHNGVSFQPMAGAPWYVIRNQIVGNSEGPVKFRGADRFVFLHNTVVNWSSLQVRQGDEMLGAFARNNVWISVNGGTAWTPAGGAPRWSTDLDYDGFDWGSTTTPFVFGGTTYADVASYAQASGMQRNGLALPRQCFPTLDVPAAPPASVPPQELVLSSGCPAVDAGQYLPGVNDGYVGAAPDLGAFESGAAPLHFGPR